MALNSGAQVRHHRDILKSSIFSTHILNKAIMTVHFSILAVHEHAGLTTECMDAKKLDVDVKVRKAHNFWMGKCTACCVSIYRLLNARQMTQALSTLTLIFRTVIDCFVLSTSMPYLYSIVHTEEFVVVDVVDRMDGLVMLSKMP